MVSRWFFTGTSSGFGRLWAEAALRRGDSVVATARNISALDDLATQYPDTMMRIPLDVTDRLAVFRAIELGAKRFDGLDVVVNNAGYGHFGMVEELSEDDLRSQMETNFFGAAWVTQAALPQLRRSGGRLLQITSEGGIRAYPGIGAYHASKWALEGLSESLRQEASHFGVHVTCVEPGPYETNWLSRGSRYSDRSDVYEPLRQAGGPEFLVGDPAATVPAIMRLVDDPQPPARLLLGRITPEIEAIYADRLDTWRQWRSVADDAFGRSL